jgi:Flp pilus assembly protein TadG
MSQRAFKSGQSLIEFALVIPLVIFTITGFLDISRAIYYDAALSNAVREGTRYALVHEVKTSQDVIDIENIVKNYAVGLDESIINITVTAPSKANDYHVSVSASYPFNPVTPGLGLVLSAGGPLTLTAQSTMQNAPSAR